MSCEERTPLEREHVEAEAAFDGAQARLRTKMGVSPKEEFIRLSNAVDQAWKRLVQARSALDHHIQRASLQREFRLYGSVRVVVTSPNAQPQNR
jgi:transposase